MKHQPERTCIGCRTSFPKDQVVRLVAGPGGLLIDYREKLPGRAAYVCPVRACIEKALARDLLSRALKARVPAVSLEQFLQTLGGLVMERVRSLIAIAVKAGKLAAGYSAVGDAIEKGRVELLLYARDISDGTRDKLKAKGWKGPEAGLALSRQELGGMLSRELVGVAAILDKGIADAVVKEIKRFKSLININD